MLSCSIRFKPGGSVTDVPSPCSPFLCRDVHVVRLASTENRLMAKFCRCDHIAVSKTTVKFTIVSFRPDHAGPLLDVARAAASRRRCLFGMHVDKQE